MVAGQRQALHIEMPAGPTDAFLKIHFQPKILRSLIGSSSQRKTAVRHLEETDVLAATAAATTEESSAPEQHNGRLRANIALGLPPLNDISRSTAQGSRGGMMTSTTGRISPLPGDSHRITGSGPTPPRISGA